MPTAKAATKKKTRASSKKRAAKSSPVRARASAKKVSRKKAGASASTKRSKVAKTSSKKGSKKGKKKAVAKKASSKKKTAKKASKKKVAKKASTKRVSAKRPKTASKKKVSKKKPSAKKSVSKKGISRKATVTKKTTAKKASKKKSAARSSTRSGAPAAAATAAPATRAPQRRVRPAAKDRPSNVNVLTGPVRGFKPYQPKRGEAYMNDAQLKHFREILLAWKRELMEEVDRTMDHMKDDAANFPDPNDRATQESEFGLELRTRDRERKLLRKIDSAISRIDEGTYGYCEETGDEIGLRRLEARPVATLCLEAQERRELAERQFRDREDYYR